jgi:hypothetical protein
MVGSPPESTTMLWPRAAARWILASTSAAEPSMWRTSRVWQKLQ